MIDARLLNNLIAWSAQVTAIVAVGTLAIFALRLRVPRFRHAYWRLLLAVCVALPLLQVWQAGPIALPEAPAIFQAAPAAPVVLTVNMRTGHVSSNEPVNWPLVAGRVILAGVVLRLLWTAIGLWRLRGLRRAGTPAGYTEFAESKARFGVLAEIRYVRSAEQPVTFGLWRPVVILPDSLRDHPDEVQRAVVSHELCHVKRRDWAWLLVEEGVRAALWFHPAVWWVISRIHLTREEAVDAAVVVATGQRRVYAEALMAFADEAPLTPVAAFSRRRHLFTRLMLISKEAVMSSKRAVASCAALAAAVAVGGWFAVEAFPLQGSPMATRQAEVAPLRASFIVDAVPEQGGPVATAPRPGMPVAGQVQPPPVADAGPLERQAKPITPENPIPRRTYSVPVQVPPDSPQATNLVMIMRLTVDGSGSVAEARMVGLGVTGRAGGPVELRGNLTLMGPDGSDVAKRLIGATIEAVKQWHYDPPFDAPLTFDVRVPIGPDGDRAGDRLTAQRIEIRGGSTGGVPGALTDAPLPPAAPGAPIRVGGAIMVPAKTVHVNPEYPAIAMSARVQGVVILELVINAEGRVQEARVLRSIPLLDQAALNAVRQWEFTPTLLNGQPTPVIMTATVQFSLPAEEPQQ